MSGFTRNVRLFHISNFLVFAGGWSVFTANGWFAYKESHSVYALIGVGILSMLPGAITTFWSPTLSQRFSRRKVLVASSGVFALLHLMVASLAYQDSLSLTILLCIQFIIGAISGIAEPVRNAYMKDISAKEREHRTPIEQGVISSLAATLGLSVTLGFFFLAESKETEARIGIEWANLVQAIAHIIRAILLWHTQAKSSTHRTVASSFAPREIFNSYKEILGKPYTRAVFLFSLIRDSLQINYFLFIVLVVQNFEKSAVEFTSVRAISACFGTLAAITLVAYQRISESNWKSLKPLLFVAAISSAINCIYPHLESWEFVAFFYGFAWLLSMPLRATRDLLLQNIEGEMNTGHYRAAIAFQFRIALLVHLVILAPLPSLIGPRWAITLPAAIALLSYFFLSFYFRKSLEQE